MSEQLVRMIGSAVLVAAVSVLCYLLDKKRNYSVHSPWAWQIGIGLIYGILTTLCIYVAPIVNGLSDNVQNIVPVSAGLIFGAPAAIIAGVLGAAASLLNPEPSWAFARETAASSLIFVALLSAYLRYRMFNNKISSCVYGLGIGVFAAAFHMLSLMVTHMDNLRQAYAFVATFNAPMLVIGSVTMAMTLALIFLLGKKKDKHEVRNKGITQSFEQRLLVCILAAFVVTCAYSWMVQTKLSEKDTENLLRLNIVDLSADIRDVSDKNILQIARLVEARIDDSYFVDEDNNPATFTNYKLNMLLKEFDVSEIHFVDEKGIISSSTVSQFVGFDMASGAQSAEFLPLLRGRTSVVQEYQPISYDKKISRKFAGIPLSQGGFLQIGYGAEQFQKNLDKYVAGFTRNKHVGETGGIIICDKDGTIVSDNIGMEGYTLRVAGMNFDKKKTAPYQIFQDTVGRNKSLCMYAAVEGYSIVTFLPVQEVMFSRDIGNYITAYMEIVLFGVIFMLIYFLVKGLVVDNIHKINASLAQIASGNLDVKVEVRSNQEFESLSDDINSTVTRLKEYIAEAAARIDRELEFARTIQESALPKVFPPWPQITAFDIYASMDTAKEVGGDFYDFFLVGDKLGFVLADVSGKGIPAALFMMKSKTEIKNRMEQGGDLAQAFTRINAELCENNDANMFVTVFAGILDYKTGELQFINAGHNKPLLFSQGRYNWLEGRSGMPLASFDTAKYKLFTTHLNPGDVLFTYTDGVTEATDAHQELYSDTRLLTLMNKLDGITEMEQLLTAVKADVDKFAGGTEQADDITMLAIRLQK